MPAAIVLRLRSIQSGSYQYSTGVGVQGMWFDQWNRVDPLWATHLHNKNSDNGPAEYTLSPLLGLPASCKDGAMQIDENMEAWVRLTTLTRSTDQALKEKWLHYLPKVIMIYGLQWRVVGRAAEPQDHPLAGYVDYEELNRLRDMPDASKYWRLQFHTPTCFNGANSQFPFPLPNLLLRSWLQRWNAFSEFPFDSTMVEAIEQASKENLVVSGYQLSTLKLTENKNRTVIGCVGDMSLRAIKLAPSMIAVLNLLFEYSFFCGSGYHTTQGLGQTILERRS